MTTPRFTVVICTYGRADAVAGCIDAVLAQEHTDFELIVVDDGSPDATPEVCARYDDPRFRAVRQENGGLSAARNTGISLATGEFLIFIDDDDRAHPDWLATLDAAVRGAARPSDVGVVTAGARFVDPDGVLLTERLPEHLPNVFPATDVRVLMLAGCFAVRRDVQLAIGPYEETILTTHQTELGLRLLPYCEAHGLAIVAVDRPLVDIEERAIADRPLNQPTELLDSLEFVLRRHGENLSRDASTHAQYHSVAGVSAAQIGEMGRARRHLRRAARLAPSRRHVLRAVASHVPGGARYWRRHW